MLASSDVEARRTSKKYVCTFIFSMRTGTPIEKLHVVTKFFMIAVMSVLALYMFDIPVSEADQTLSADTLAAACIFPLDNFKNRKVPGKLLLDFGAAGVFGRILLVALLQRFATRAKRHLLSLAWIFADWRINSGSGQAFSRWSTIRREAWAGHF